jgi:carbon-monoxide dehydrogenase medium subunit
MKPSRFTYHRPRELPEALDLLSRVGGDGKVLAGGQSLVPMLSMRLVAPAHLVDINALPGLDGIEARPDGVRVGALVRHAALERHDGAAGTVPLLRQALRHVAHPTIRNRGTSVGSIAHADPSAELPAVLTLLGGRVVAASVRGEREVVAADLFAGPLETTVERDELVVAAVFPALPPRTGTAVVEVARRHGDYAVCGVVAAVTLDGDGAVVSARACYVTAGELGTVVDLSGAVRGAAAGDEAAWQAAAAAAHDLVAVDTDIHASARYRGHLVTVLTRRALLRAADDASGPRTEAA